MVRRWPGADTRGARRHLYPLLYTLYLVALAVLVVEPLRLARPFVPLRRVVALPLCGDSAEAGAVVTAAAGFAAVP